MTDRREVPPYGRSFDEYDDPATRTEPRPAGEGARLVLAASGKHDVRVHGTDGTVVGAYDLMINGSLEQFVDGFDTGDDSNWTLAFP